MTAADRPSVTPRVGDTITTAEQLDALPSLAIVIDANDEVQQRHGHLSTERGDYSAWLGVMPPTCKPSPEVALPVTVLYVPGEPSRPSVTDDAHVLAAHQVESRGATATALGGLLLWTAALLLAAAGIAAASLWPGTPWAALGALPGTGLLALALYRAIFGRN